MDDLTVGEAKRRQTGARMCVVAPLVFGLLEGSAVVAQAVGLDHEAEVGPVEVDPVSIQLGLCQWDRQARFEDELEKEPLELGGGERDGRPVEQPAQSP